MFSTFAFLLFNFFSLFRYDPVFPFPAAIFLYGASSLGLEAEFDLPLEPIGRRIHAYGQNRRH